jgi:hypothetical protein
MLKFCFDYTYPVFLFYTYYPVCWHVSYYNTKYLCHKIVAWRVPLVEQELFTLPKQLSSPLIWMEFVLLDIPQHTG